MNLALRDIAELVGGRLAGDGKVEITGAAILRDAQPGDLTLVDKPRLLKELASCQASAVLVPQEIEVCHIPSVAVRNVHDAFARIVEHFHPQHRSRDCGVSNDAFISRSAQISAGATVHAGASIGDDVSVGEGCVIHGGARLLAGCQVGRDVTIFPNAVLYEDTIVGNNVIIHAGAVIGAYGFGYETSGGRHIRSAQLGHVEIGDDVEIGACTTIDRGTYGPTRIGEGTKIDNLVMVAHNCSIGKHNLLCSQVGIAGSCTTGDYVVMAGQVGLRDHISVGNRAVLGAKAGVMNDIPEGSVFVGIPATPEREQRLKQVAWSKLPEMRKEFLALQKQVANLLAGLERANQEVT